MKIIKRLYILIFIIIFITCKKYNINEASDHYKKYKDTKSLKILARTLKKGMLKNEVEELFGESDFHLKSNENTSLYITNDKTNHGNSIYVLTVKFDYKNKIMDYYLKSSNE